MATALSPPDAPRVTTASRARRILPAGPARQAACAVLLVLVWQGLSTWAANGSLLPSPMAVAARAWDLMQSGALLRHMMTTLGRVLVGYVIGAVLGIAFGVALGRLPHVEALLNPTLSFVRSIPPIAFVPVSIIIFGIGETSKYTIVGYLVFIVLALSAAAGVREIPQIRIRAARALGADGATVVLKVMLPSAFPFILNGLRVALNLAFMAVASAELIGARAGLGYLIMDSQTMLETDKMLVGILCLGILGGVLDRGANLVVHRALGRFTHTAA
jgi:ABC-type nitrate/sulfonate/bicarbonate transport system permease component